MPPKNRPISYFARPPAPPSSAIATSDPFEPLPQSSQLHIRPPAQAALRTLAVDIPASTLRPIAFRVFTKKHNLTLKSDALTLLCSFVGRRCGADWRDTGSGEKTLDEVARQWKRSEGAGKILVDGGEALKSVLKGMEVAAKDGGGGSGAGSPAALSRSPSFAMEEFASTARLVGGVESDDMDMEIDGGDGMMTTTTTGRGAAGGGGAGGGGGGGVGMQGGVELDQVDAREYTKFISAFEQPRLLYNSTRKVFEKQAKPCTLPPAAAKTALSRHRYALIHARLMRNDSFLAPTYSKSVPTTTTSSSSTSATTFKLTSISALLGRASQSFLLFGQLAISPSGILSLYDPSGEIALDVSPCTPSDAVWFVPGMFVLLDGTYEDTGTFTVFSALSPPPERRAASAEVHGHIDFLGAGIPLDFSSPSTAGAGRAMRKVEHALPNTFLILGAVALDDPRTLPALRQLLTRYESESESESESRPESESELPESESFKPFDPNNTCPPLLIILTGPFTSHPVPARTFKDHFDDLAKLFSDFPRLVKDSTLVLVPGESDPWASTAAWPRRGVPDDFTTRLRRVVRRVEAVSNPCRISYFTSEIVIARDDVLARLQRNAVRFGSATTNPAVAEEGDVDNNNNNNNNSNNNNNVPTTTPTPAPGLQNARKLVKTLLDQSTLSPFVTAKRPVLWEHAPQALSLWPLPSAMLLVDPLCEDGWSVTYEGCNVLNPGRFVKTCGRGMRWGVYRAAEGRGVVMEM